MQTNEQRGRQWKTGGSDGGCGEIKSNCYFAGERALEETRAQILSELP